MPGSALCLIFCFQYVSYLPEVFQWLMLQLDLRTRHKIAKEKSRHFTAGSTSAPAAGVAYACRCVMQLSHSTALLQLHYVIS